MVAEGMEEFRKEPLACFAVDKMQRGPPVATAEGPANLIMSYKFQIHRMIVFYKFNAKIRVFENLFIGQHQTSLLKTIFAAINKKKAADDSRFR